MTDTSAPRPILALQDMYRHLQRLVETRLWLKVLIAMFLGIGLGVALSGDAALVPSRIAAPLIDWLALPGLLFIRLIQMIMIPLVVSSVIRGIVGGGDPAELKVLGPRVAMFFLIFTVAAIIIGIGLASWLRPGDLLAAQGWATDVSAPAIATERPTVTSFITDLLPENPLASMVSGEMLSIVAFAIIAGIAMLSLDAPTAEPVIRLLGAVQEICMTIIRWAMKHKWASCSTNGHLNFSTALLAQPRSFQDEVIVHELLHLRVPNHGKLFKSLLLAHLAEMQEHGNQR